MTQPPSVLTAEQKSQENTSTEDHPPAKGMLRRLIGSPVTVAIVSWLLATPVAVVIPRIADVSPFSENGVFIPLGAGGLLLLAVTAVAWRRPSGELVAAAAAGLFAAWVILVFRLALYGSPFGTTGWMGDRVRVASAATRDVVTLLPADQFVTEIPSEYPPLFPWLVARASLLLDVPVWRLLVVAEVGLLSFTVLAAFLMWRRIVPAPAALVISGASLFVYGDPRKAFAIVALFVVVPWLVSALAEPKRGGMHWLPAGIIGGLIMLTYNGWYTFGAVGFFAVIVSTWRRSANRAAYLRHVLLVAAVSLVLSAPYLIPWGWALLTSEGQAVSDEYVASGLTLTGFPFLKPTLLGMLQFVGLAGLVWYRGRTDWARPLLYLVLGGYVFWLVMGIRFVFSTHTTLFFYVPLLVGGVLVPAGVLTLATAGPALVRKFGYTAPRGTGTAVVAVAMVWVMFTYWQDWKPNLDPGTSTTNTYSAIAHLEPWPDCRYPRFAPVEGRFPCFPADSIKAEVEKVRGVGALPHTLAWEERMFAYTSWPAYIGADRTASGTLTRWDDRQAELKRLAQITDPAEFARVSANTQFGPIDVFVLYAADATRWTAIGVNFHRDQFDPAVWTVVKEPALGNTVVAIRKP